MAACGTRSQYTQPPNGSLSGAPSASTSARLAPDADTPRRDAPCAVGFAVRDDVRRNRPKPGTLRSASSSAGDAASCRSVGVTTDTGAAPSSRSLPRVAVTLTVSSSVLGIRVIRNSFIAPRSAATSGTTTEASDDWKPVRLIVTRRSPWGAHRHFETPVGAGGDRHRTRSVRRDTGARKGHAGRIDDDAA